MQLFFAATGAAGSIRMVLATVNVFPFPPPLLFSLAATGADESIEMVSGTRCWEHGVGNTVTSFPLTFPTFCCQPDKWREERESVARIALGALPQFKCVTCMHT
jgi:hypothetical protein